MSGNGILLDTNAVIDWNRREIALLRLVAAEESPRMTLFTLGELYFGARKSTKVQSNIATIQRTIQDIRLLLPNEETASIYGEVRGALRRKGRSIPENDIWIAALALQRDMPLITRDAHFSSISGLITRTWSI